MEDSKKEKPKPQRTTTNSHHLESTQVKISNTETIDNNNSSVNLVKIIMKMIENNKLTNSHEKLPTHWTLVIAEFYVLQKSCLIRKKF